ncbi:MAG: VWA domain-containing protein [Candidatus Obscuribacterales bacterium]|nr:VWA domain-containing protein [Candidatus Obscuribacterales bacterium]
MTEFARLRVFALSALSLAVASFAGSPAHGQAGDYVPMMVPVPSGSSNNPYLQTGTGSTTLQTGTGSTTLQTGTGSTTLQVNTDSTTLQTGVERQGGPVHVLFIVDASRSMLEGLGGGTQKIDAAKQVLQNAIARIPPDVNFGLRVFGHGYQGAGNRNSLFGGGFAALGNECRNSALLVPIGTGNRRTIIEKVRQIRPYGMTPLAYSIEMAAASDFRGLTGNKTIILISDGQDTCGGNPCEVIRQLPKYGIKIKVDVVGLNLRGDPVSRNQLNCIANESGGKYYDADTAAKLIESVSASVSKAIEGRVIIRPSGDGATSPALQNILTPPELVPIEPMKEINQSEPNQNELKQNETK